MIDNRTKSIPTSSSEVGIYYVYISQGNKDNGVYIVSDFVLPITVTKIAELYIGDSTKANLDGGNIFTGDQIINGDITVEDITANNFLGNASTATKLKTFININGVAFDGSSNITIYDTTKEATITPGNTSQYFRGDKTWQTLNKIVVGLSNVDNTADANKNVLSATKLTIPRTINNVSFDGSKNIVINAVDITPRIPISYMGIANGVATLDVNGIIPITQLPSYVDDVIEVANYASLPIIGESGKIYVTTNNNKTYRWSGSVYVYITSGAVDSVNGYTGVVVLTKSDFILGNVDNTSDANKPISIATQGALDLKQNLLTLGNFTSTTPGITISNGNGAVIGSGITFNITTAGTTTGGLITSGHWNTFNNKWDSSNHPITTLGYGLPDYPTTLPASDVYSWAKQSTKPTYSYSEITSKPTLLSQFTNDLGNYGNWITGINSGMITTALGYTPLPTRTFGSAANNNTGDFYAAGSTVANSSLLEGHNSAYFQVAGSYAPASGSANYIQNQNASAQSANMWISGINRSGLQILGTNATTINYLSRWGNGSNEGFLDLNTGGAIIGSSTGYFQLYSSGGQALQLNVDKSATFASTVNATQLQSTVATGTAPLTVNSTTIVTNLNANLWGGNKFVGVENNNTPNYIMGAYPNGEAYYTTSTALNSFIHGGLSTNYIPKWNGSSFINAAIVVDNASFYTPLTMKINNATQSTSPTTGALVVNGGMGVDGNINVGSTIYAGSTISNNGVITTVGGLSLVNRYNNAYSGNILANNGSGENLIIREKSANLYWLGNGSIHGTDGSQGILLNTLNSNTSIGYTTDQGYKLAVNGTGYFNGTINATNYIGKSNGFYTVQITQAAYTALGTKDASTIYMIVG